MTLLLTIAIGPTIAIACGEPDLDDDGSTGASGDVATGSTGGAATSGDSTGGGGTFGDSSESDSSSAGAPELPPPPQSIAETVAIYGSAWNETDVDRRRALLELAWADDGVYRDPTVIAEGRDALVDAIGAFQQALPGSTLTPSADVDDYGDHLRFAWQIEGPTPVPGLDIGEVDDELRLVRITGFFGELPTQGDVPPAVQAYADAWNEPDAAMRAALLAEAVDGAVAYRDPSVELAGIDALSDHIAATQAMLGGAELSLTSAVDAHGPVMRYTWRIGDVAAPVVSGLDMAVVGDDGRLVEILGFFDA